jgi:hypothetical protein
VSRSRVVDLRSRFLVELPFQNCVWVLGSMYRVYGLRSWSREYDLDLEVSRIDIGE